MSPGRIGIDCSRARVPCSRSLMIASTPKPTVNRRNRPAWPATMVAPGSSCSEAVRPSTVVTTGGAWATSWARRPSAAGSRPSSAPAVAATVPAVMRSVTPRTTEMRMSVSRPAPPPSTMATVARALAGGDSGPEARWDDDAELCLARLRAGPDLLGGHALDGDVEPLHLGEHPDEGLAQLVVAGDGGGHGDLTEVDLLHVPEDEVEDEHERDGHDDAEDEDRPVAHPLAHVGGRHGEELAHVSPAAPCR